LQIKKKYSEFAHNIVNLVGLNKTINVLKKSCRAYILQFKAVYCLVKIWPLT